MGRVLRRLCILLSLCVLASFRTLPARAQMFGLAALLDPEGSRLFPQSVVAPRHPGKPDPRWRHFNWQFTDLNVGPTKFRLYFYDEENWSARFVAPRIESQVAELSKLFNFTPPKRFAYILFTSLREFRQANVFFVSEGVQGVTSTTEATMAIPYWGSVEDFDHVSTHEMVHQFQVQKMEQLQSDRYDTGDLLPLWFIEGQAEYYSQHGIDPQTRAFVRDVLTNPNKKKDYTVPTFIENGLMDYVHIYKLGQAKIDFMEKQFGKGAALRLLEYAGNPKSGESKTNPKALKDLLGDLFKLPSEEIEKGWRSYLDRTYLPKQDTPPIQEQQLLKGIAPSIDFFRLSPSGHLLAEREVDELTGIVSIYVLDPARPEKKKEAIHEGTSETTSLYFFQNPSIALSDQIIAYIAEAPLGPELELRAIDRNPDGAIRLGPAGRIELHKHGLLQASSVAISPDGNKVAFTALNASGWSNVYIVEAPFKRTSEPKPVFSEPYDWQTVSWTPDGLFASSNRTSDGKYGIFQIDLDRKTAFQIPSVTPKEDKRTPEPAMGGFVYESDESGISQIHFQRDGEDRTLTHVPTGAKYPVYRNGELYAVVLHGGRFRVFHEPVDLRETSNEPADTPKLGAETSSQTEQQPWAIRPIDFAPGSVQRYRPFRDSSTRIDGIIGYFASGGALGLGGGVSDLFRDYNFSGELSILGSIKYSNAYMFLSGSGGRPKWTLGAYAIVQPRLDNIFPSDDGIRTYLHREYGALGAVQYPLGIFSYVDAELRIGGVKRSDISDPNVADAWNAQNPGTELMFSPVFRIGYDGILYEMFSGPLKGFGILAETETSYFPRRQATAERIRLDVAQYFQLTGRTILAFQAMTGSSWGKDFGNPFLISSDDILRGYPFLDERLYGNYFSAVKSELRFPIGTFFGFPPLRGLIAYDLGTVYRVPGTAGQHIEASRTLGLTLNIPPLSINFMVSEPLRVAPGPSESVAHFTLRYLYL